MGGENVVGGDRGENSEKRDKNSVKYQVVEILLGNSKSFFKFAKTTQLTNKHEKYGKSKRCSNS